MIERFIENELTLKRWKRFKKRKSAYYSTIILIFMIFLTFAAPFIANSRPIYMKYQGNHYFPVIIDYHPREFGITDSLVVDYRSFNLTGENYALWPIVKWDPFESNTEVDVYPSGPTWSNLMGTDQSGRDVFTRLLYGFKFSISYAVLVWFFSFLIGTILGGMMGFYGGRFDFFMQRFVEVFSTVPTFFLLLILISIFTPNLFMLVMISTIFGWISISYYVRGEFLRNRKREFVEAAKALGASDLKVIFKHILPNSLTSVITFAPFVISGNIAALAGLDYLGFGLEVPTPSWGELLNQAHKHYSVAWWLAVYPSLALFFSLTLLNLIGEGVRDAMDPNMN
ncbi:MAG: ABC transporter permease subunit [Bdellovibrio sp.]